MYATPTTSDTRYHMVTYTATEISELNIQAGELSGELRTLRVEGCGLRDGVRCVEEDMKGRKWEKEREMRSRVADLQTEAIRLRRELEVVTQSLVLYLCTLSL